MPNLFVWASVVRWRSYRGLGINALLFRVNRIQAKAEVSSKKRLHVVSEWRGEDRELPKKLLRMIHVYFADLVWDFPMQCVWKVWVKSKNRQAYLVFLVDGSSLMVGDILKANFPVNRLHLLVKPRRFSFPPFLKIFFSCFSGFFFF